MTNFDTLSAYQLLLNRYNPKIQAANGCSCFSLQSNKSPLTMHKIHLFDHSRVKCDAWVSSCTSDRDKSLFGSFGRTYRCLFVLMRRLWRCRWSFWVSNPYLSFAWCSFRACPKVVIISFRLEAAPSQFSGKASNFTPKHTFQYFFRFSDKYTLFVSRLTY